MSWAFNVNEIVRLHLEISNYCNLQCPSCARETRKTRGQELNTEFLAFDLFKEKITPAILPKLKEILFCGNIDEPTLHPEFENIIKYFGHNWPKIEIYVSTNGATRDNEFWKRLGMLSSKYNFTVIFAIDGLEDTNQVYRVGANWNTIVDHFREFNAVNNSHSWWQFVVFDHNKHQINKIKKFASDEGFDNVLLRYSGRPEDNINVDIVKKNTTIICKSCVNVTYSTPSIFISYTGGVTPCCYTDLNHSHIYNRVSKNINLFNTKHNLYHSTLHDIIEGEFFNFWSTFIYSNRTCEIHCKENIVDIITNEKVIN